MALLWLSEIPVIFAIASAFEKTGNQLFSPSFPSALPKSSYAISDAWRSNISMFYSLKRLFIYFLS
jgi:hypothetical protein